jgi:hypothetical protein
MKEHVRKEVICLLDPCIIYTIKESDWVSQVHCVPNKGGFTVEPNENRELVPIRPIVGYTMYIDFRKLNEETRKDPYPLPCIEKL